MFSIKEHQIEQNNSLFNRSGIPLDGPSQIQPTREPPQIEFNNVSKYYSYPFGDIVALNAVNFSVHPGEFVTIIGPKGSGKSSLINLVGCMDSLTSGTIQILGRPISRLNEKELDKFRTDHIGFISPFVKPEPELNLLQVLQDRLIFSSTMKVYPEKIHKALQKASIPKQFWELPSGELPDEIQYKGMLARALVTKPEILVLDEPMNSIDICRMVDVFILLKELNSTGITIIIASEDKKLAKRSSRQLWLNDGYLIKDDLVKQPIQSPADKGIEAQRRHIVIKRNSPTEPTDAKFFP